MPQTISLWDILTSSELSLDREKSDECTSEVRIAASDLAKRVSKLLDELGVSARVSSGFRTKAANTAARGSRASNHLTGKACDLEDPNGFLDVMITDALLARFDLYREHPLHTAGWVHLQTVRPHSGNRTFLP